MRMFDLRLSETPSTTILFLGAHSDDIEIGCGGTILRLAEQYPCARIVWVVLSSNASRAEEARRSYEAFLVAIAQKSIEIKEFRDGYFPYEGGSIKDFFEDLKRREIPELIFTHYRDDRHQDHRLVSDLTWNTFRNHLILEYEIPKYDGDLGSPNLFVSLPSHVSERKVSYLMDCFNSQRSHKWFTPETFLGLMRLRGMECNAEDGYSEAFYCRKVVV